jgi:hypothetical protein
VTASLAAISANSALALPAAFGARATATRTSTGLLFRLNGQGDDFAQVPAGSDLSGSVAWNFRPHGTLKLFGIRQSDNLVVDLQEPSYTGTFSNRGDSDLLVLSGDDVIGDFAPRFSVSTSGRELRQG